ncbi:GNAT family N-acetyltransferase [Parachitinimonas caeni]|uniref:GNAT family N-acetyltransferase n=1 Tax=Parachitinimonas caeni TaxID=3031301 RepID=A0ABT7E577_9NEIS|nr:GNAT family N-acetyltransferase [Parachitinimonas caeni]MDK2126518.1 GNAT family N-acetyltransferase [Parachitinimonas caeni]
MPEGALSIRLTALEDWQILKQIRLASLRDAPSAFVQTHAQASAISDQEWQDRAAGLSEPRIIMAFIDGKAVGMIGGIRYEGEFNMASMWVSPEFRQIGIASKLITGLKTFARNQGYIQLILQVAAANNAAIQCYLRQGFQLCDNSAGAAPSFDDNDRKMVCLL